MAKAISSEELQLRKRARRRLVGAIALVVIVVVFVPMILDNEPQPVSQDISINLPPPAIETDDAAGSEADSGPLRFRPVEQPPAGMAIEESPPPAQTAAVQQQAPPAASEPPAPAKPASSPTTDSTASAIEQSFVVQLGAFSNAQNATRLAAKGW